MLRGDWRRSSVAYGTRAVLFASCMVTGFATAAELPAVPRQVGGVGTMEGALIQAYRNNPQLNAQRAATRATDEAVPTALSGYRPKVAGNASYTQQHLDITTQ